MFCNTTGYQPKGRFQHVVLAVGRHHWSITWSLIFLSCPCDLGVSCDVIKLSSFSPFHQIPQYPELVLKSRNKTK